MGVLCFVLNFSHVPFILIEDKTGENYQWVKYFVNFESILFSHQSQAPCGRHSHDACVQGERDFNQSPNFHDFQEIAASLEQFRLARGRRQLGNRLQDILARQVHVDLLQSHQNIQTYKISWPSHHCPLSTSIKQ